MTIRERVIRSFTPPLMRAASCSRGVAMETLAELSPEARNAFVGVLTAARVRGAAEKRVVKPRGRANLPASLRSPA